MLGEEFIRRIFSFKDVDTDDGGSSKTLHAARQAASSKMEMKAFAKQVKSLFKSNRAFVSGSMQMLGFSQLEAHFGDQWPRVSRKVHALTQSILRNRLSEADCYTVFGENTYVIVFSSLSVNVASLKVALIAEELSRKLFGDTQQKDVFNIGVVKVSGDDTVEIEALRSEDLISKMTSFTKGEANVVQVTVTGEAASHAPEGRAQDAPQTSATVSSNVDVLDWRAVPHPAAACLDWAPIREAKENDEELYDWVPIEDRIERPADLTFVYRPAWLIKNEMIAAHTCVPARVGNGGLIETGGNVMPARRASLENSSLDLLSLERVLEDFTVLDQQGRSAFVILPVHVQTFESSKYRNPYKEVLTSIPKQHRAHIVFELIGINRTVPTLNVATAVCTLRPFCKDLMIRTRLQANNLGEYQPLGIHAVGVDLGGVRLPETEVYAQINAFNVLAKKHRFCTFAHGIETRSLASGAVAAGFRYIDGGVIASPVEVPEPNRAWTARDVYTSLIEALETDQP